MRGFVRGSIRAAWLVIVGLATSAAVAQTSELYLTDFNSSALWVVQGGQILRCLDGGRERRTRFTDPSIHARVVRRRFVQHSPYSSP